MIGKLTETEEKAVREFSAALRSAYGETIKQILLFGSKARGDFHKESDIDIFILVDKADSALRRKTASLTTKILLQHSVLLSPKIVEESHFSFLKQLETAFAKNIEKDGIIL
jgi:predicted nucleotidyltransferase